MRIGILIDEYVSGSAPVLATQESRCLQEEGFETKVLVGTKFNSRDAKDYSKNESIEFMVEKYPKFVEKIRFRFPLFSFFSPQHLLSTLFAPLAVKEGEFDLIIAHGSFSALIAYSLKKKRGIPFFTIFWDPSSYILPKVYKETFLKLLFFALIPLTRFADVWISKNSDRLILGSKFHVDWFSSKGIKDVSIVYPGCFPAAKLPERRGDFVLAVDRWDIGSLPDTLIEVLRNANLKFKLKIVGHWHNQQLKKEFLHKVKRYGLESFIEVTGPVSFEKLQKLFLEARCFVHPTLEAFGMAALEAASYGCPLIIPSGSGVTDLFVHGKHGFFPKDKSIEEFSKYIEQLVADQHLAYQLGYSAWQVAQKYTWRYHAQQLGSIARAFFYDNESVN